MIRLRPHQVAQCPPTESTNLLVPETIINNQITKIHYTLYKTLFLRHDPYFQTNSSHDGRYPNAHRNGRCRDGQQLLAVLHTWCCGGRGAAEVHNCWMVHYNVHYYSCGGLYQEVHSRCSFHVQKYGRKRLVLNSDSRPVPPLILHDGGSLAMVGRTHNRYCVRSHLVRIRPDNLLNNGISWHR